MTSVTFENSLPYSCPLPFPFLSVMLSQYVMEKAEYISLVLRCEHMEFPSCVFLYLHASKHFVPKDIHVFCRAALKEFFSKPVLMSGIAPPRYSTLNSDFVFWAKTMYIPSEKSIVIICLGRLSHPAFEDTVIPQFIQIWDWGLTYSTANFTVIVLAKFPGSATIWWRQKPILPLLLFCCNKGYV